jgi:ATP-binding cassette, subfamily B, bacterial
MAVLRGMYEPYAGTLLVNGAVQDDFHPLYDRTTLIPQEPEIFENTIHHNLTLGINYTPEQIEQCVQMASFDTVLNKLPFGYQTDIREKGVNLSGGEKQRLALTRGLLAGIDSEILVMDEPSSSLDARTEATVFDRIFDIYASKTLIISLHRLHILPRFDRIIVMDRGKIVDQGSFKDLVGTSGPFKILWDKYQGVVQENVA